MRITTILKGAQGSALLMHNSRLADDADEFKRAISEITAKKKDMTDTDRREVARLEWYGGIYANGDGPVMPTANIRRCFQEAAKITKKGKQVERGLIPLASETHLEYKGPRDLKELWESGKFAHEAMVGIQRGKVKRVRPMFREWSLSADWELITGVLNLRDLKLIVESAGISIGLGDNRGNGYGRFSVEFGS